MLIYFISAGHFCRGGIQSQVMFLVHGFGSSKGKGRSCIFTTDTRFKESKIYRSTHSRRERSFTLRLLIWSDNVTTTVLFSRFDQLRVMLSLQSLALDPLERIVGTANAKRMVKSADVFVFC